jgi:Suppressor of fused protein (SUFU)
MEKSESGAPIYRHESPKRDFEFAVGDSENIDRITNHIEAHIGPVATVFHEIISDLMHIDIHIVEPSPERNCYTLVTSGMSDRAMNAPEEYAEFRFSELLISLPPDWPMNQESWNDEANYWPIRMLKFLARFPHEYQTWLWALHTIPNGNPPEPFACNTQMTGVLLLPPITLPEEFQELVIDSQKTIYFHSVVPLHSDEMELKLKKGAEALFDGFEKQGVSELLNPMRASVVTKKRSWFPFIRRG